MGTGTDYEHGRPSSSGGRLEQHLGAVESVGPGAAPAAAVKVVGDSGMISATRRQLGGISIPGYPPGVAKNSRINNRSSVGETGIATDHPPGRNMTGQGGGPSGGGSGSSGSGRPTRHRRGGKRWSTEQVLPVGATGSSGVAGGRGRTDGGSRKTQPRQRGRAQAGLLGPSGAYAGSDGGGGGYAGDRRGRDGGEEARVRAVRGGGEEGRGAVERRAGTDDRKFRMQAGQSNTLVAVRLRPLSKHDREQVEVAKVLDNRVIVLMDPAKVNHEVDPLRVNRTREKRYAFDHVFDASATQRAVYENTTKFLIKGVLDGFNATVFAYGCTGAGKTYTMIGNDQEGQEGIMYMTLQDLFSEQRRASEVQDRRYSVTVSFLEVYNENIRDLLNDTGEFLDLREDPIKGPTISGLAEVEARTPEEIMNLLNQGNQSRTQQATRANAVSSRSHAVLQVVVESRDKAPGTVATMHLGKLSLVDLAGSERAAATQNRGVRLVEGANINRSLLALGNCINALGEKGNRGQFVPYRDSKLTRLLKDSLGGNCRTVMIANISGASSSFEETLNTLKYANRAKNIKTNATRNSLDVNHHISEYVNLIGSLRTEIARLKHQLREPEHRNAIAPSPSSTVKTRPKPLFATEDKRGHERAPDKAPYDGAIGNSSGSNGTSSQGRDGARGPMGGKGGGKTKNGAPDGAEISATCSVLHANDAVGTENGSLQDRDFVEEVREKIVENFRERMQLRRSLIELEDQNVQNSIEVGKRQLSLVEWHSGRRLPQEAANDALQGLTGHGGWAEAVSAAAEAAASGCFGGGGGNDDSHTSNQPPPTDVRMAWKECEQLNSAISKNNEIKRKISRRLRNNSRQAEKLKSGLDGKITGEDRNQLMKLQYRIGKLELDNMELEQSRIVHESAMRGKDLTIQKLQLQLAVRDRTIELQQAILADNDLVVSGTEDMDTTRTRQGGISDSLDPYLPGGSTNHPSGEHHRGDNATIEISGTSGGGVDGRRGGRLGSRGRRIWNSSSDSDRDGDDDSLTGFVNHVNKRDDVLVEDASVNTDSGGEDAACPGDARGDSAVSGAGIGYTVLLSPAIVMTDSKVERESRVGRENLVAASDSAENITAESVAEAGDVDTIVGGWSNHRPPHGNQARMTTRKNPTGHHPQISPNKEDHHQQVSTTATPQRRTGRSFSEPSSDRPSGRCSPNPPSGAEVNGEDNSSIEDLSLNCSSVPLAKRSGISGGGGPRSNGSWGNNGVGSVSRVRPSLGQGQTNAIVVAPFNEHCVAPSNATSSTFMRVGACASVNTSDVSSITNAHEGGGGGPGARGGALAARSNDGSDAPSSLELTGAIIGVPVKKQHHHIQQSKSSSKILQHQRTRQVVGGNSSSRDHPPPDANSAAVPTTILSWEAVATRSSDGDPPQPPPPLKRDTQSSSTSLPTASVGSTSVGTRNSSSREVSGGTSAVVAPSRPARVFGMGISGTGIAALPSKDSNNNTVKPMNGSSTNGRAQQHQKSASSLSPGGGASGCGVGGGANGTGSVVSRRRLRREQARIVVDAPTRNGGRDWGWDSVDNDLVSAGIGTGRSAAKPAHLGGAGTGAGANGGGSNNKLNNSSHHQQN